MLFIRGRGRDRAARSAGPCCCCSVDSGGISGCSSAEHCRERGTPEPGAVPDPICWFVKLQGSMPSSSDWKWFRDKYGIGVQHATRPWREHADAARAAFAAPGQPRSIEGAARVCPADLLSLTREGVIRSDALEFTGDVPVMPAVGAQVDRRRGR